MADPKKTFKDIVNKTKVDPTKIGQPKGYTKADQKFIDKHTIKKIDYPLNVEDQFTGNIPKDKTRKADQNVTESANSVNEQYINDMPAIASQIVECVDTIVANHKKFIETVGKSTRDNPPEGQFIYSSKFIYRILQDTRDSLEQRCLDESADLTISGANIFNFLKEDDLQEFMTGIIK